MFEDIFPTLNEFSTEHSEHTLRKLCLEIQEFCLSIYSTLETEDEKKIFFEIINKVVKK